MPVFKFPTLRSKTKINFSKAKKFFNMDSSEESACPICFKTFSFKEIDAHVNRCLFLNAEESNPTTSKRTSIFEDDSVKKKQRMSNQPAENKSPKPTKAEKNFSQEMSSAVVVHQKSVSAHGSSKEVSLKNSAPLAEQMRPLELAAYVGQEHVLGVNKVLRQLLDKHEVPSMILWGPPGCGKTTLAHIIANQSKSRISSTRFVKLSATSSGVNDVKEVVKVAANELKNFKRRTILFMDEIHRFNKLQQDIFLPHVENGTIILIGATTENPSFSLNSALLSRCRVIVLEKLQPEQMRIILERAITALDGEVQRADKNESEESSSSETEPSITVDEATLQWLAEMCDGDARIALNSLHMALQAQQEDIDSSEPIHISLEDIKDGIKRSHLMYDRKGDEHYNIISAVHKSIRASDDNAALYWVTRMLEGGEDPVYVGRRLVRAAAEDIGLADPQALPMAVAAMQGCQMMGMPECDVLLAQCAVYLARAPKSQEVYRALLNAKSVISNNKGPMPGVPLHLRNTTSKLVKDLGWGQGYNSRHKDYSGLNYMPEGMENVNFFDPRSKR